MIERYSLPEMQSIWSEENKLRKMLEIEVYACEAMAELGLIPERALKDIQEKADFDLKRVSEIEETTRHDVLAFLTNVAENVGEASKYIHLGMTSSDILDTALATQMKEALTLILHKLNILAQEIKNQAIRHKYTLMVGRTHGIHAEPVTFGLKMALWYDEVQRNIKRLEAVKEEVSVGKISGAVGTFANIDPYVEEYVCKKLGLKPAPISTQIIQRDIHAAYMTQLAVTASSLDKFALEVRNLQRTDIHEVEESFAQGQKGSSAMPHKKNPILSERVSGLARVVRGNASAALENVALWHERDITHSSVERLIIPDSTHLVYYMLDKFINVVKNLVVNKDNMQANLNKTLGLVFSQRVLLALVEKGILRETAYAWVQRNSLQAWESKVPLKELVTNDGDIAHKLSKEEIEEIFNYDYHLKNVDYIFKRVGIE
ncbi:MAG: adenylosuccinate lyase [Clostridia bacterium]|uniref:adenylosuccinate lyase n=1 Tax=Desulfitibacter alkalitolerans TaxID=264641 RepID=UPI000480D725|nr:adenylosuccinate lyase [Desulfitibacter alkalitolerans]MBS3970658.1 adenylosuccinate lyase [Clostridia bacterium]